MVAMVLPHNFAETLKGGRYQCIINRKDNFDFEFMRRRQPLSFHIVYS